MDGLLMILLPLFFLTALVYSTAGFGGGSTYLALLALVGFPYQLMPELALACNLIVVSGGFWVFYRGGWFSPRKTLPFLVLSIPMAYLGGRVALSQTLFLWLLAFALCAAGLRLFWRKPAEISSREPSWSQAWKLGIPVGALLGGLSGLVGIGGGIFLAPVLYFLGWSRPKEIAASASFFILVNSVAGLAGQMSKSGGNFPWELFLPLGAAVLVGGQIGSRVGAGLLPRGALQRITALLILGVGLRIFWNLL